VNALVLIIAGVFVLAGITLIVLSIVLFRGHETTSAEEEPPLDEPYAADSERTFIDEPLQTDFSVDLGPVVAPPNATAKAADDANGSIDVTAETPAPSVEPGKVTGSPSVPAAIGAPPILEQPDLRRIRYSFRVQTATDHVRHGRLREGIDQFEKALTLTDDPELRSQLLIEVGNAWRDLDEREPAAQAYAAAAEQTADEEVRAQLRRRSDEMREHGGPAGTGPVDESRGGP
jgi:hypothetical protein